MQASTIALRGMAAATARFEASAWRTARAGDVTAQTDLTHEVVEQVSSKHAFSANLRVLEAADFMTRQLLDMKA